ncbi:MAG TPA: site-2 protease family protein [Actinomycetota bacterium]|nr:site-2 protease family protein [Actinomycetota bacterium]
MDSLRFALYLLVALAPGLVLHEYAHALAADRLGDPSPRRWGRLTLDPRPLIDPFGTIILPALALILVAADAGFVIPVFAYAKPMPLDARYLRDPNRDSLIVVLAGLGANLVLAAVAGVALRFGLTGEAATFAYAWLVVNVFMFVIQLMPVPGLDGSKLLARVLSARVREIYQGLDQYIVLFMLAIFFLLGGPFLSIVNGLVRAVCTVMAGAANC